jgi:hypothetical protein
MKTQQFQVCEETNMTFRLEENPATFQGKVFLEVPIGDRGQWKIN